MRNGTHAAFARLSALVAASCVAGPALAQTYWYPGYDPGPAAAQPDTPFNVADILPDDFFDTLGSCPAPSTIQRYCRPRGDIDQKWAGSGRQLHPGMEECADADGWGDANNLALRETKYYPMMYTAPVFLGMQGDGQGADAVPAPDCADPYLGVGPDFRAPDDDPGTSWAYESAVMAALYNGLGRNFRLPVSPYASRMGHKYVPSTNMLPYSGATQWVFKDVRSPAAGMVERAQGSPRTNSLGDGSIPRVSLLSYYNALREIYRHGYSAGARLPRCGFDPDVTCPPNPLPETLYFEEVGGVLTGNYWPNPSYYPPALLWDVHQQDNICLPGDLVNLRDYSKPHPDYQRHAKFYHRSGHAKYETHAAFFGGDEAAAIQSTVPLGDLEEALALTVLASPGLTPHEEDFRMLRMTPSYSGYPGTGLIQDSERLQYLALLLHRFRNEVVQSPLSAGMACGIGNGCAPGDGYCTADGTCAHWDSAWADFIRQAAREVALAMKCSYSVYNHNAGGAVHAFLLRLIDLKMKDLGIDSTWWDSCSSGAPGDATPPDSCGDLVCDAPDETCINCPEDCGRATYYVANHESTMSRQIQELLAWLPRYRDAAGNSRFVFANYVANDSSGSPEWGRIVEQMDSIPGDGRPSVQPLPTTEPLPYLLPIDQSVTNPDNNTISCWEDALLAPKSEHAALMLRLLYSMGDGEVTH